MTNTPRSVNDRRPGIWWLIVGDRSTGAWWLIAGCLLLAAHAAGIITPKPDIPLVVCWAPPVVLVLAGLCRLAIPRHASSDPHQYQSTAPAQPLFPCRNCLTEMRYVCTIRILDCRHEGIYQCDDCKRIEQILIGGIPTARKRL